jgi:hypothetical protein
MFFKNLQIGYSLLIIIGELYYYTHQTYMYDNISAILFFLKLRLTASNKTCFSSRLNGEAIAKALIVSSKLCFSMLSN